MYSQIESTGAAILYTVAMPKGLALALVAAAATLAIVGAQTPQSTQPTFHAGTRTVAIYATVQDHSGRLVPDLTQDDFRVFDDGKPVDIVTFSRDLIPITVAVMLDMSGSMNSAYLRVRDSADRFVDGLLPDDRVRIGSFGDEVTVSPLLTGDKTILHRILHEELWPGGSTPLWTALATAMASLDGESGRRVIFVLTDGVDNCSLNVGVSGSADPAALTACVSRDDVEGAALRGGFMFYAIGTQGQGLDETVADLTTETGGGHFELKRAADLDATFARVADELHHQYAIGFLAGVLDGKVHKIDVRLTRQGLTARARKNYVATDR